MGKTGKTYSAVKAMSSMPSGTIPNGEIMNSRTLASIASALVFVGLSACSTSPTRQQVGIGTGAVLGGVVGNAVGGGTLGTVGGAAVGGVIGNEVTKPHK
jgi:osmotically inducible lipoprotein OsmB